MSFFSLFFLYSNFLYFRKSSLTVTFPYFRAISSQIFIIFLDSTKLQILRIPQTTRFNHTMIFFKLHKRFLCNFTQCFHKLGLRSISKKITSLIFFKHLHSSETCFDSYSSLCFKIIDKANSKFDLKIKEALHVNWRKPNLNAQQNHLSLTLSQQLLFPLLPSAFVYFSFVVFCIFLSSVVFIISTLINHRYVSLS